MRTTSGEPETRPGWIATHLTREEVAEAIYRYVYNSALAEDKRKRITFNVNNDPYREWELVLTVEDPLEAKT